MPHDPFHSIADFDDDQRFLCEAMNLLGYRCEQFADLDTDIQAAIVHWALRLKKAHRAIFGGTANDEFDC